MGLDLPLGKTEWESPEEHSPHGGGRSDAEGRALDLEPEDTSSSHLRDGKLLR